MKDKDSEDDNSKFSGGRLQGRDGSSFVTIDQLDKEVVILLQTMKAGDYSKPISSTDERGKKIVKIFYLQTRTEPHRENLKDDYARVSQRALEEKKNDALEKWFVTHIPNYFIQLDTEFQACDSVKEWLGKKTANN